ncbi:MAG: hypothetical protein ACXWUP_13405 [Allosphingosinicella sp.]
MADTPCSAGEGTDVLDFLADPASYPGNAPSVETIETHMSRIFLAGDRVYKLKKPIRLGFVDFTTLEARRLNCRREIALNQRLAPGVYLDVLPLVQGPDGRLSLGGEGEPVEWLLVMARLPAGGLLDHAIAAGRVRAEHVDSVCNLLGSFYGEARRITCPAAEFLATWTRLVDLVETSLTDRIFALPAASVGAVVVALRTFLERDSALIAARLEEGRIVDGHGDLRPEHIHLGPPVRVIDGLEFDDRLRWVDPFDEVGFLGLECEMLGAPWVGVRLSECLSARLGDRPSQRLLGFYRCYRAALRARLSIEHLRDRAPRTPDRWPRQARAYIALARRALPDQS